MSINNIHAASEDDVGILHNAITKLFNKKAKAILDVIEEDPDAAMALVSGKDMGAMCKWVLDNGITATPAVQQEESKLSKRLAQIKAASQGKVINFTDVKEA
ncbi:terminase small subunit [Proteus phage vB_PmiP_Pm5460]|uniref:Terminase small subunit n=1 Tax=Proteus phage vB_PmiP_Pm5460 TaxID=1636249 RepID=A0A0G2SS13_9CAUD|nr:terminase small subunit [Proteus phage vB_PmiP_Pm5460]AKA61853.1 terminase small subunit [Proteus phage vB_PmiP_Pm5460]